MLKIILVVVSLHEEESVCKTQEMCENRIVVVDASRFYMMVGYFIRKKHGALEIFKEQYVLGKWRTVFEYHMKNHNGIFLAYLSIRLLCTSWTTPIKKQEDNRVTRKVAAVDLH